MRSIRISVVIATYRRAQVLVNTLSKVQSCLGEGDEILVMDQTEHHDQGTREWLKRMDEQRTIRWVVLSKPSIPKALNAGLLRARGTAVLILDDDIDVDPLLIEAHRNAHAVTGAAVVAGRVIQPWDSATPARPDGRGVSFNSGVPAWIQEFMAGNFSVERETAIKIGGFDENFVGAAYRFERDFADRLLAAGHEIYYEPRAWVRHLKVATGGTRQAGSHLTSATGHHSVGEYYYLMLPPRRWSRILEILRRPFRAVATRFHLRRPWYIPITLLAEARGFLWALGLIRRGRRLLPTKG